MTQDVVIAGGGPNGLMLAGELALAGVRPTVLERLPEPGTIPKANGLVGQIVRLLDHRGLLARFAAGSTYAGPVPRFQFGPLTLDLASIPGGSPLHILAVPQQRLEQLLSERALELGTRIDRGHELLGFTQDDDGVTLDVRGPDGEYQLRTRYLVGCDGAHSVVRKQAGIGFPGYTGSEVARIGRVTLPDARVLPTGEADVPGYGRVALFRPTRTARGRYTVAPLSQLDASAPPDVFVLSMHENGEAPDTPMTLAELQASARRVLGADLPMRDPLWLTRTVGNSRLAETFRVDRVFLAGDAAHLFNAGGSGLNAGMLDAVNLGWKLAAQINGWAPPTLLDTYHTERHASGERTLMQTRAQAALAEGGAPAEALATLFGELTNYPEALRHIASLLQGNDIHYDLPGPKHPLLGRWAPDDALRHLSTSARPVLIGDVAELAIPWADRIDIVKADQPTSMLIRPDCHVAWAGDNTDGLLDALHTWFG